MDKSAKAAPKALICIRYRNSFCSMPQAISMESTTGYKEVPKSRRTDTCTWRRPKVSHAAPHWNSIMKFGSYMKLQKTPGNLWQRHDADLEGLPKPHRRPPRSCRRATHEEKSEWSRTNGESSCIFNHRVFLIKISEASALSRNSLRRVQALRSPGKVPWHPVQSHEKGSRRYSKMPTGPGFIIAANS